MDWIDLGYAAILALGGAVGYIRKACLFVILITGSKISLIAGLVFGSMAGYGAYCIAHNPRDVKFSLFTAFILTTVMGVRFKRSKKLMPAGIIAALSLLMILRLVLRLPGASLNWVPSISSSLTHGFINQSAQQKVLLSSHLTLASSSRLVSVDMDWIDFGYAAILAFGGAVGYVRKGSKISLIAGLVLGSMAGYGAYSVSIDPEEVKYSLITAFILTTVMGVWFKRSKKLMPAGIIAALSLLMILRLVPRLL
ncbi:hypothetical protein lerEdw1_001399 [Lerista edwardsae]|nr:hypothetical protein lerEdw1_001399 [Lerista edwardsae]